LPDDSLQGLDALFFPDATREHLVNNDPTSEESNSVRRDGSPSERDENAAPVAAQIEEKWENWGSITLPAFLGEAANKWKVWPLPFNRWRVTGGDAKGRRTTFVLSADTLDLDVETPLLGSCTVYQR